MPEFNYYVILALIIAFILSLCLIFLSKKILRRNNSRLLKGLVLFLKLGCLLISIGAISNFTVIIANKGMPVLNYGGAGPLHIKLTDLADIINIDFLPKRCHIVSIGDLIMVAGLIIISVFIIPNLLVILKERRKINT